MASNESITKLPPLLQIENALLGLGGWPPNPFAGICVAQWTINTWRAQYRTWRKDGKRGAFIPLPPRRMRIYNYLVGESCNGVRQRLRQYGISSIMLTLAFEPWPDGNGVGLSCDFYVPGAQRWMADVVLRWFAGSTYAVESPPVRDKQRGDSAVYASRSTPWRPWGVPAKARSWDEAMVNAIFDFAAGRATIVKPGKGRPRNQTRADLHRARKR